MEISINPNSEELAFHREKLFQGLDIETDYKVSKVVGIERMSG